MRKVWLWIVLIVSLMANVGFVGGYAGATLQRDEAATRTGALQLLAQRLDLGVAQIDTLKRHRGKAVRLRQGLENAQREDVEAFWAELVADRPNRDRLAALAKTTAERQVAFTLDVAEELRAFMTKLAPEQRQEFVALIRARPIFQGRFLMTTHRAGGPGA